MPDVNLGAGGGTQAGQTAELWLSLKNILCKSNNLIIVVEMLLQLWLAQLWQAFY